MNRPVVISAITVREFTQTVYLCGPMSGIPQYNKPAFHEAAGVLRAERFHVLSPAELSGPADATWEFWMRKCIPMVCQADAVFALPGWYRSRGAKIEIMIAKWLKIPVYSYLTRQEI